jgi:hypothetical protein
VIDAYVGISFAAGDTITVAYASGQVSVGPENGWPYTDANGDAAFGSQTGFVGLPSQWMTSPNIYIGELVGVFANNGVIVGAPFAIGDIATLTVPAGANQLLLGVNDDVYFDNVGSYEVVVTGLRNDSTASAGVFNLIKLA